VNNLLLKPSDAMDHGECREIIRGNWRDSNSGTEAELNKNCTFLIDLD